MVHPGDHPAGFIRPATVVPEDRAVAMRLALVDRRAADRREGPTTVAATPLAVPPAVMLQQPAAAGRGLSSESTR